MSAPFWTALVQSLLAMEATGRALALSAMEPRVRAAVLVEMRRLEPSP